MKSFGNIIERSAILRPFNYLRVRYEHRVRYNLIYPLILTSIGLLLFIFLGDSECSRSCQIVSGVQALTISIGTLISLMPPFFLAALAAIVRLTGVAKFDRQFSEEQSVKLLILKTHGEWELKSITPKHFISLAIGYSFLVSLVVISFSSILQSAFNIGASGSCTIAAVASSLVILFLLCQLLILMLLVVYYLSDYVYRDG